jgi:fibronectin type III domain protein
MKVTPRFMIRAALVVTAGGVIAAFGACKSDSAGPPPPPPPPSSIPAPSGLTATVVGSNQINLAWTDNATNETGFRVDRCTGAGCTNFAQVGTNLAVNSVAFSDMGLVASTSYSYRVRAFSATDTSSWTPTASQTTGATGGATSFTMVGAGEITTCASSAGPLATAHIVDSILKGDANAIAFTAGNNLADMTAGTTFQNCFDPKWGSFKSRTYYSLGNADFGTDRGPNGVYGYFGDSTAAGTKMVAHKGWFSFDKGSWHIVVLNTSDWEHGTATYGIDPQLNPVPSEQVDWLAADLQANTKPCVAVISWERRFYTTGASTLGRNSNMRPMANLMYENGVDLLISAKDKLYARFAQMNPADGSGTADPKGIRQFIVGTGGRTLDSPVTGTAPAGREADLRSWGVLKLTLGDGNYSWEFIPTVAGAAADKSTAPVPCH